MTTCPICSTSTRVQREGTPYWTCAGCGVWFQDPFPPKVYHGLDEPSAIDDRMANQALAKWLFENVLGSKPALTLDVGCKWPLLAAYLGELGCEAFAIDGVEPEQLPHCSAMKLDFENSGIAELPVADLWTFVHVFEHLYDPLAAFRKIRARITETGALFIRMPDHTVAGYERDLTPHHYSIHPFFHCLSSVAELCARTECFVIERRSELPGQRDIVLRPI